MFNPTGQAIRIGGLLCLFDAAGPRANGVTDEMRASARAKLASLLSHRMGEDEE